MSKRIAFVTSIDEDWGGSEELWANTAIALAKKGFEITVIKKHINFEHQKFIELSSNGIKLISLQKSTSKNRFKKAISYSFLILKRIYNKISPSTLATKPNQFLGALRLIKPKLLIVCQGDNFDGLNYAFDAWRESVAYITIAQKAKETNWPYHAHRNVLKDTLKNAKHCLFVSNHNQWLTEEQFGERLSNAKIIRNPIKIKSQLIYPKAKSVYKLACIGRYYLLDKGQDILIRILSKDKWKNRPIHVSFVGYGEDKIALQDLASLLNVNNISFDGYFDNIEEVFSTHHALILPSRNEGMPLSILEAMAAARPVIVSNVAGNSELVKEGLTGFIGEANETDFELALDRAWNERENWEEMGKNASGFIVNDYLKKSDQDLLKIVLEFIDE